MTSQTDVLNKSIARCKTALPLPELWKKLGLRGEPKQSCLSPFREEANPSFSVFQKDGLWFWKDFATGAAGDEIGLISQHRGCKKGEAIRLYHELAGIELPQFANQTDCEKSPGDALAIYNYLDADGNLLHQTLRFAPKLFRQRRPASEGLRQGDRAAKRDRDGNWWLWTLDGIETVLYRLPELLAASPSLPVFLCEGEKDAESLGSVLGEPTTTAPMGAGKWRESYTRTLRSRDVIIIPHRDPMVRRRRVKSMLPSSRRSYHRAGLDEFESLIGIKPGQRRHRMSLANWTWLTSSRNWRARLAKVNSRLFMTSRC